MKKNMVKSLLLLSVFLTGCNELENSSYTPQQIKQAEEFCKKDNTTLSILIDKRVSGNYIKGMACKDSNESLYKLEVKYGKRETNNCGRQLPPCFETDYSKAYIEYKVNK